MDANKNPVDIYIYLPIKKTQEHFQDYLVEDEKGKSQINDIQAMEKAKIVEDLRKSGVLSDKDDVKFIFEGDDKIKDTQIAIPSKNFARITLRYDSRQ